jgi:hypothetical protein
MSPGQQYKYMEHEGNNNNNNIDESNIVCILGTYILRKIRNSLINVFYEDIM